MLSNLNTNMKILIGISSITILGIIYAFIKNMFKPKNKMIEGYGHVPEEILKLVPQGGPQPIQEQPINTEVINDLINLLTDIKNLQEGHFNVIENNHIQQIYPTYIKKHILYLDSRYLQNTEIVNSTYTFILGTQGLLPSISNPINIKCLGVQIPYVPHNIYKGSNSLSFFNGDKQTIDEGYYTIYTLINKINTTFPEAILSFDNVSKYVKITNASNASMTINITDDTKLFKKLGFQNGDHIIGAYPSGSLVGTNIPDISIHYIDITCDQLSTGQSEHTNNKHIFKRIPFNNTIGDIIYYETPYAEYLKDNNKNVSNAFLLSDLTLTFIRDDDTYYDFKGLHFNIKLEITSRI